MPLQVDLVSADRTVWSGTASTILARTLEGEIGILPGHSPVLALLAPGEIRIVPEQGEPVVAEVNGGFLSVEHDRVTVVSDTAQVGSGTPAR